MKRKGTRIVVPASSIPRILLDLEYDSMSTLLYGSTLNLRVLFDENGHPSNRVAIDLDKYQSSRLRARLPQRTLQDEYGD